MMSSRSNARHLSKQRRQTSDPRKSSHKPQSEVRGSNNNRSDHLYGNPNGHNGEHYHSDWNQQDQDELRRPALPLVGGEGESQIGAGSHLTTNLNAPPSSGLQYLFMVRKEAQEAQQTVVADISEAFLNSKLPPDAINKRQMMFDYGSDSLDPNMGGVNSLYHPSGISDDLMPTPDWISSLIQETLELRSAMTLYRRNHQTTKQKKHPGLVFPPASDHEGWFRFCHGSPGGLPTQVSGTSYTTQTSPGKLPMLSIIGSMNHGVVFNLIQLHITWIEDSHTITDSESKWIFALLIRLDSLLSGDEMSILRDLSKACQRLRRTVVTEITNPSVCTAPSTPPVNAATSTAMPDSRIAACTMAIAIVHSIFGQKDLT
ncbi:hypothetical protein BSLG_003758 [Batrachochytrium salamandrivorans]|nr:hypothetical protein BASA60_008691 [Batrachochytrium salamandrivorans]KAJ1341646.1 hypothetical protein BSLG_003758 [Batrachochytrium salamandrivorans]